MGLCCGSKFFLKQFSYDFPLFQVMIMTKRQRKIKLNWFENVETKKNFEPQHDVEKIKVIKMKVKIITVYNSAAPPF